MDADGEGRMLNSIKASWQAIEGQQQRKKVLERAHPGDYPAFEPTHPFRLSMSAAAAVTQACQSGQQACERRAFTMATS